MTYTDHLISTMRRVCATAIPEAVTVTSASYDHARALVTAALRDHVPYPLAIAGEIMADAHWCAPGYGPTYATAYGVQVHVMRESYPAPADASDPYAGWYSVTVTTRA